MSCHPRFSLCHPRDMFCVALAKQKSGDPGDPMFSIMLFFQRMYKTRIDPFLTSKAHKMEVSGFADGEKNSIRKCEDLVRLTLFFHS